MRPKQQPLAHSKIQSIDIQAETQANLTWSQNDTNLVIKRSSDYTLINSLKNAILLLRQDFFNTSGPQITIFGQNRDDLDRRLLLIQHQLDGLLRRDILYNTKTSGGRSLDYTNILNEKENQIVELQKKIQNLEDRLRKSGSSQGQLQNHIAYLTAQLKRKDELIKSKNDALISEIANKTQIKQLNFSTLNSKDWGTNATKFKASILVLFRQMQNIVLNSQCNQQDLDKILENFLLGLDGSRLQTIYKSTIQITRLQNELKNLHYKFSVAGGIWKSAIHKIRKGENVDFDLELAPFLLQNNIQISSVGNITQIQRFTERTVEIPVQDARTKHLIHLLTVHMKRFIEKYPQLRSQLDTRLFQFFQQEVIDVIEVDQFDRLVEIVKYVPQVVKVENVYAYSSQKSRRIQFHLRVLVKALLQQLQKLRLKSGIVLQIDEGIIGMINQQIMGLINVDDILKVFRVVPKIVEVQKVIEKIVERVVEVPQVIPVEKLVQKIIEVPKIQEIQKIVNIPIEITKVVDNVIEKIVEVQRFVEKVVEVPRIVQKVVERIIEVPKIVQVQKIVQRIVPQTQIVNVQRVVERVVPQIRTIQVVVQKIVPVEKIVEKIVQVPTYIEKIIQKPLEVVKVVQVEKIVQRLVKETDFKVVYSTLLEVVPEYQQIERIVQKVVVVQKIVQKIVQVPQIVQKIVQVTNQITHIKEVPTIKEKLVPVVEIKQIERVINQVVPLVKQVEKVVDRRVEVPIIQQRIVKVPQIINQVVIEHVEIPKIVEVQRIVQKIVTDTKLLEVQKPIIHYVKDTQVVKSIVEKIIQIPRTIERIKEVRVNIDKLIEKMVEVPKVIEVEKIVQKIVVVPRVIQKIVEVPQIVEKIVERIIEIEKVREVQKLVQIPVITEKVVQVQVPKNVYVQVEKIVQKIIQKVIPVERVVQKIVNVSSEVQRIIQVNNQVPKIVEVEKIVPKIVETQKLVEIERPVVLAVEVPIQVERIVEKVVHVEKVFDKVVQVPQIIQKVVQVHTDNTQIKEVDRIIEKVVVIPQIKQVPTKQIVIQQKFNEVPTIRQKIVPIKQTVKEIVEIQKVLQKIVQRVVEVPKMVEVTRNVDKIIEVPKVVELEVIVPQLVKVNQIVEQLVEKIVQIPVIQEVIKEVEVIKEKIVQVHTNNTQIKQVQVLRDKVVQVPQVIEIAQTRNFVETNLQVVQRIQEREVPIYSTVQKFLQVPHVLQKIVERIVILPQVVQVLKYVHEINDSNSLVAVGVDVSVQEVKYKQIYSSLKSQFDILITELRKLRTKQPQLAAVIVIIEKYLSEFDRLAAVQRIVRVDHDRIVEKQVQKPIIVPTQDSISIAHELSQSLLIEKLVLQLKRITKQNPLVKLSLDEDTLLIFFSQLYGGQPINISNDLKNSLSQYTNSTIRKLTTLGGNWTNDHALMLNTILQERFTMANLVKNANLQIQKAKAISDKRLQGLRRHKMISAQYGQKMRSIELFIQQFSDKFGNDNQFKSFVERVSGISSELKAIAGNQLNAVYQNEPLVYLGDIYGNSQTTVRFESLIRQSQYTINALRNKLIQVGQTAQNIKFDDQSKTIDFLKSQLGKTSEELSKIKNNINLGSGAHSSDSQIKIKTMHSKIQDLQSQLRGQRLQYQNKIRVLNAQIQELKSQLSSFSLKNSVSLSGSNLLSSQNMLASQQSSYMYASQQSNNMLSSQSQYQSTPQKSLIGNNDYSVNQSPYQSANNSSSYGSQLLNFNAQSISSLESNKLSSSKGNVSYGIGGNNILPNVGTRVSGIPITSSLSDESLPGSRTYGQKYGTSSGISKNSFSSQSQAQSGSSSNFTASFGNQGSNQYFKNDGSFK